MKVDEMDEDDDLDDEDMDADLDIVELDLTMEPPRSPKLKLGGFVHLPRMIDKCRAEIAGKNGEYHYNCPTDKRLLSFLGIDAEEFKEFVAEGAGDEEILEWVMDKSGKSEEEIDRWTESIMALFPAEDPEMSKWFIPECERLGLDPEITTLFDYLEVDDIESF